MRILITGGTGSIGQILARKLLERYKNTVVVIFSRDEQKQEKMQIEFKDYLDRLRFFLGDVRDKERLKLAVTDADVIIHTAALKIVPALEYNPMEAIKTNIIGTQNLIDAAIETSDVITYNSDKTKKYKALPRKVISLSTDKAVMPVNLYGATKLCSEKLILAANNLGRPCIFSAVRYGNVAMSRGSVIPKFIEQRDKGETLTITDERMTRFWITLDEASDFVLDCLDGMRGGEVFIPKMKSFRIIDLARIINSDKIEYIGIRPGEKIHEKIISEDENAGFDEINQLYILGKNEIITPYGARSIAPLNGALTSENFKMPIDELNSLLTKELLRASISDSKRL